MKMLFGMAALLAGAAMVPGLAQAGTYVVTFTGTVSNGYDYDGVFGTPDTYLNGAHFVSKYYVILPNSGYNYHDTGYSETFGGAYYGVDSVIASASFSIENVSFSFNPTSQTLFEKANYLDNPDVNGGNYDYIDTYALQYDNNSGYHYLQNDVFSYVNNFISSDNLNQIFSASFSDQDSNGGYFQTYDVNVENQAYASLVNETVSVSLLPSAVPEPATWGLMILGFGAVGGAMRRRPVRERVRFA